MTDKMVDVGGRRRSATPTSAAGIVGHHADVGLSVGQLGRRRHECRKTGWTMSAADTLRYSVYYPSVCYVHNQFGRKLWCNRTGSVVGGVPPTTDGECQAGRHTERRRCLGLADATNCSFQFVLFLLLCSQSVLEGNCGVIGRAVWLAVYRQPQMVNTRRGDTPKGASPSLGRRHKLQFSVCIVSFVMFTISLEGNCGVIGPAVWLAVYRQPRMLNAGRGDAPKGASPSLGSCHKLQFSVCILFWLMFTISVEEDWGVIRHAVRLAVYRQQHMVNAGRGNAPKGTSCSLG